MSTPLILASQSPRRKELLEQIGLVFTTRTADVDERVLPGEASTDYAVRVALEKAQAIANQVQQGIIIAADTIVVLNSLILGKPEDEKDAERLLSLLSGKMHSVVTGLVVLDAETGRMQTGYRETRVWFRALTAREIQAYIQTGEPLDKAGAYGIQGRGALLIEKIEGCFFNVVGLPISLLQDMFKNIRIELL